LNLLPNAEQLELVRSLGRLLADSYPVSRLGASGRDPASGRAGLAALRALGWLGVGMPERCGGVGLPLPEQALIARELGGHLMPLQTLGAILASRIAALAGDDDLALAIAEGDGSVALLVPDTAPADDLARRIDGYLVDEQDANLALWVSPRSATLIERCSSAGSAPLRAMDGAGGLGRMRADDGVVRVSIEGGEAFHHLLLLLAAYAAGMCNAICSITADFAKLREQFGQPIGAFQAVKHRCADMAIRAEVLFSQVAFAAAALSEGRSDGGYQALCVKINASNYAIASAQDAIQLHGAIGTTEELVVHHFLKRAHLVDLLPAPTAVLKAMLVDQDDVQDVAA